MGNRNCCYPPPERSRRYGEYGATKQHSSPDLSSSSAFHSINNNNNNNYSKQQTKQKQKQHYSSSRATPRSMHTPLLGNEIDGSFGVGNDQPQQPHATTSSYYSEVHQNLSFQPMPTFDSIEMDRRLRHLQQLTRNVFDCYDLNKDGVVSFREYSQVARQLAILWKRPISDDQLRGKFEQLANFSQAVAYPRFEMVRLKALYGAYQKDVQRQAMQTDHDTWEESAVTIQALQSCTNLHYHTLQTVVMSLETENERDRPASEFNSLSTEDIHTSLVSVGSRNTLAVSSGSRRPT